MCVWVREVLSSLLAFLIKLPHAIDTYLLFFFLKVETVFQRNKSTSFNGTLVLYFSHIWPWSKEETSFNTAITGQPQVQSVHESVLTHQHT